MEKRFRVADFFCGAGGFSEGFSQAGFRVVFGVDRWKPALTTFRANQIEAITLQEDIEKLSQLPDEEFHARVPDTEIIIGSPPCVAFSNSNKSGNGDKALGIRLVEAYLRIVARKKWKRGSVLKHWILENVPKIETYIKETYSAKELLIEGDGILRVKNETSGVYDAQDFGVPSRRKRYFCGEFPEPKTLTDQANRLTLGQVLNSLGTPMKDLDRTVVDPIYKFAIRSRDITDHHYLHLLAEHQWKSAERLKRDKGYMGVMAFPEDESKPSRTIMATLSLSVRESMILSYGSKYRIPSIREVATLMSFPIDYLFHGESVGIKYRQVGNAVPPKLAYGFAKSIAKAEGLHPNNSYRPLQKSVVRFTNLNFTDIPISREIPKNPSSRFKYHIPYLILDRYRVELTNHHSNFTAGHIVWTAEIHRGQGKNARIYTPKPSLLWFTKGEREILHQNLSGLSQKLAGFKAFQDVYRMTSRERREKELIGPYEILQELANILNHATVENQAVISSEPYILPGKIAAGYFMLSILLKQMGGENESRT